MPNANKIIVKEGQCIMDIAIQEYGTVAAVFLLVDDNSAISKIDTAISPGQILRIRETDPLKEIATINSLAGSGGVSTVVSDDDQGIIKGSFNKSFSKSFN